MNTPSPSPTPTPPRAAPVLHLPAWTLVALKLGIFSACVLLESFGKLTAQEATLAGIVLASLGLTPAAQAFAHSPGMPADAFSNAQLLFTSLLTPDNVKAASQAYEMHAPAATVAGFATPGGAPPANDGRPAARVLGFVPLALLALGLGLGSTGCTAAQAAAINSADTQVEDWTQAACGIVPGIASAVSPVASTIVTVACVLLPAAEQGVAIATTTAPPPAPTPASSAPSTPVPSARVRLLKMTSAQAAAFFAARASLPGLAPAPS